MSNIELIKLFDCFIFIIKKEFGVTNLHFQNMVNLFIKEIYNQNRKYNFLNKKNIYFISKDPIKFTNNLIKNYKKQGFEKKLKPFIKPNILNYGEMEFNVNDFENYNHVENEDYLANCLPDPMDLYIINEQLECNEDITNIFK